MSPLLGLFRTFEKLNFEFRLVQTFAEAGKRKEEACELNSVLMHVRLKFKIFSWNLSVDGYSFRLILKMYQKISAILNDNISDSI